MVTAPGVGADDHECPAHAGISGQHCLDLAELDPETADLHLEVVAAQILQGPARGPPDQIAGAVHAFAAHPRAGDEPVRGQARAAVVAARQLRTGDVQFAGQPGRDRSQPLVQHPFADAAQRFADDDRVPGPQRCGDVHDHSGFRGAVGVDQVDPGLRAAPQQIRRAGLTADRDGAQVRQRGRVERAGRGRCHQGVRDALCPEQFRQFGAGDGPGGGDHEGGGRVHREQQFGDRDVEGRGREVQDAGVRAARVAGGLFVGEADESGLGNQDALGQTGRAGGVDRVRQMMWPQRPGAVRVGERGGRESRCGAG
ncbi:hypothetical protein NRB56_76160 [Nocardia sp. RB56]|uniref:Uncharacterized protein n=1 Tax=Nocardia aurantia TaxID=2585199 RepID=A0A7K0E3L2_9NOCA|nr:hypothetical protein [Nocardia aurantia]